MSITCRCIAVVAVVSVVTLINARAQESSFESHFEISAGGGFSEAFGRAGNDLNTGWNLDFRGGYRPSSHLALDLDFNYNRWDLNRAALARFGEPGGYETIWSFSFLPEIRGSARHSIAPYAFGGPGLYYRNLSLTQPGVVNTFFCDPFFGFCQPAAIGVTQVVASSTTYKGGVNFGAGLEFPLGQSHLRAFGEARYSRMFTSHGADLSFVPVTFGIRW